MRDRPRDRAALAAAAGVAGGLERYGASFAQVDFAVRDTRVLARHAVRLARSGEPVDPALPDAVRELGLAVWSLAGAYDQPERADEVRGHALRAGSLAGEAGGGEVVAQIRSTAVDLRRAADLLGTESRSRRRPKSCSPRSSDVRADSTAPLSSRPSVRRLAGAAARPAGARRARRRAGDWSGDGPRRRAHGPSRRAAARSIAATAPARG